MKFWKCKSNTWNQKIDAIADGRSPNKADFPWDELQECTRLFLKKKALRSQIQIDETLLAVISRHGSKAIALAACARWMSDPVCSEYLLQESQVVRSGEDKYQQYLHNIITVGHVKASVVNSVEVRRADFLLKSTSTTLSIGEKLANSLCLTLPAPSSPEISLQDDVTQLTKELCYHFAADLSVRVSAGDLVGAYNLKRWLLTPAIAEALQSDYSRARAVLNDIFPAWRAWDVWQPNPVRKESWTKYSCKAPRVVKDLLRLEGADLSGKLGSEQATLRKGLVFRSSESSSHDSLIGSVRIIGEGGLCIKGRSLPKLLERLTNLIDYAIKADHSFTELIAHFCTEQMINHEALELLECVQTIDNAMFTKATRRFFAPRRWPFQCILDIIPFLGDIRICALKEKMEVHVVGRTSDHLTALRSKLLDLMRSDGVWEHIAIQIVSLARELQSSIWLLVKLGPSIQELIRHPPDIPKLEILHAVRKLMRIDPQLHSVELEKRIDIYVQSHLAAGPAPSELERDLIDTMTSVCKGLSNTQHRALVIFLAGFSCGDLQFCRDCIRDISIMSHLWISHIHDALFLIDHTRHVAIRASIRLLAHQIHGAPRRRLRMILSAAIHKDEKSTVMHVAQTLTFDEWIELLTDIRLIFQDDGAMAVAGQEIFFNLGLHAWFLQIALHPASIRLLESALGKQSTLERLLNCFKSHAQELLALIETMDQVESKELRNYDELLNLVFQEICNPDQVGPVQDTLFALMDVEQEVLEGSLKLIRAQRQGPPSFANLVFAHLMRSGQRKRGAQLALTKVAKLVKVDGNLPESPAHVVLEETSQNLRESYSQLIEEARRLENLRLSLQAVAPHEAWSLLEELGIERPSMITDVLACVPESLESVIEGVAGHEVEMRFPVNVLTKMQRFAIKVKDTESFLVRLSLDNAGRPRGFCVHISGDGGSSTNEVYHFPSLLADHHQPPVKPACPGQFNRGVFQFSKLLWNHLKFDFVSLERTYKHVSTGLSEWACGCIICGRGQTRLRRATTCFSRFCQESYLKAPIEVLLADIWQDPPVIDLLLASVYAAAAVGNLSLLPNVPAADSRMILRTLQGLPRVSRLAKHLSVCRGIFCDEFRIDRALSKFCKSWSDSICLSKCLVWMCNSYRGYLTTASRSQRIPWFGDNQFLLVNSTPELEAAFSQHMSTPAARSEILFHGTSMDRLYAIICQGLRVQSGTNLQRNGAIYGPGIYMADEPATAWGYTVDTQGGWNSSSFQHSRVLLGCELAGEKPNAYPGIQVIKDPSRLAVRYVFILNGDARMPAAKDIHVPMASMFRNFRSGAW